MPESIDHRIGQHRPELESALRGVYPDRVDEVAAALIERARVAVADRPQRLRDRDSERPVAAGWHLDPRRVGYATYVDRFAGDLDGVVERLDHLVALGVDTLHLLSVLHARHGESDGGYAIRDYRSVDPRIGTDESFDRLVTAMHDRSMSLCLDLVFNHTSDDHEWAVAARGGSERHRALYRTYLDRTEPDRYEATLPEVFPTMAPGSFTWDTDLERWVWTTFREFQWDLDWSNPDVMLEMFDIALALANRGVDILRLDAIAFTWKRLGTTCQNQPEAHLIAQALRAVMSIAAPSVVLLAEAIVPPEELVGYLGRHRVERHECELGYHNQLMVQGWSMLASQRGDLARVAISRLPTAPDESSWFTYVRCHDDIGWAIADDDASAVGLTGAGHRAYLAEYYRGDFWRSWARGTAFSPHAASGDERTCGMTAALCGITAALETGDAEQLDVAFARFRLLYAIAFGFGGIPMIWMGDEIAQLDDVAWRTDPERAGDSRWSHRPVFDVDRASDRDRADTVPGRAWAILRSLVDARRGCPHLQDGPVDISTFDTGSSAVFAWRRHHRHYGDLVGLANVGTGVALVHDHPDMGERPGGPHVIDRLAPEQPDIWRLDPLQVRWLTLDDPLPPVP